MTNIEELNLLHIVKGIDIGGNSGGAEHFGFRLAIALKERIKGVALCAFLRYNTKEEQYRLGQLNKNEIEVFFACSSPKINLIEARRNIKDWMHVRKPQLIHSHYQVGTISCLALKHVDDLDFLVRTAHADLEFGRGVSAMCSRLIFRDILYPMLVDYEIGVSKSITDSLNHQILRRVMHKQSRWIPNAIPDGNQIENEGNPLDKIITETPVQPWLITTIGILVRSKNLDLLINAIPDVIKIIPQAKLVIVGNGPEYNRLIDLARLLNITDHCWFLGQQRDINSILKASDIFVLPSMSEGLSTVLLEAMKNKVPVIASNIPGNRDLIQDNVSGRLFPPGDRQALTQSIIWAYHQPHKMKSMAQVAYDSISQYTISAVTEKYVEVYSNLFNSVRNR